MRRFVLCLFAILLISAGWLHSQVNNTGRQYSATTPIVISGNNISCPTCGAGSGTVNSGTTPQAAYYASNGTAVSSIDQGVLSFLNSGRLSGLVQGGNNSTTTVIGINSITGGAGTFSNAVATSTDPPYRTTTTGSTSGNSTGIGSDSAAYYPTSNDIQRALFIDKISTTSTVRFFDCLTDQNVATVGGSDTFAGNNACIRYSTGASDTNFMCGSSSAGTWTFTSTGVAADTNVHSFLIVLNAGNNVTCYVDGANATVVSSHVMTTSNVLGFQAAITTLTNAGATLSFGTILVKSDR